MAAAIQSDASILMMAPWLLVTQQSSGEETLAQLHSQMDVQRKQISSLVSENARLEAKLAR